jgi:diguanylate cyclase (GGDEF)-like protein/putative nucleotidyltransferase with HDIG domain
MSAQAAPAQASLPQRAKLFIATTAVTAGGVAAAALMHRVGEARGWQTFLIIVAAASITQLFAFHTIRNQVFHTTPLFFVAGAVLLEPQFAVLLPLISHIGDWIKQRYAWYIQTFNIVNFTLAVMAAWWAARLVSNHWLEGTPKSWAIGGAAAAAVYVLVNNAGFATILFLARGHSPRSILTPQVIAADAALAALGVAFASFWRSDPWLIPFAVAPVFLLHQALHLPQLQEEARVDAKTELFNARHFDEVLREEHARATRFGRPLSIIVADLDLLRNINNTYGHLAGDAVLRGIADVVRAHVRDYDVAARLGGEEFAIMLPETSREEALELAERIREAVAQTPFWADSVGEHVAATLSIGVASFPRDSTDPIRLVNAADLAAYRAKLDGRNRVAGVSTEPLLRPVDRFGAADVLDQEHQRFPRRQAVRLAGEPPSPLPARLRPAVALVTAVGIAAGAFAAAFGTSGDVFALLAIAAFVAVTQLLALRLDHGSVSVSAVGVLAGAALVGPRAALPLAVAAAAVDWAVRRLPLGEIFLDVAAVSLGALAAAGIFAAAPPSVAGGAATIVSGAAAGAAYFAVLALVYGLAAAAEGREPWWRAWRGRFAWILPHYGVAGFVAGVMAIAYRRADLYALAAFSVPLLALRETQAVFLGQAETSAENLRNATEKIQTQSVSLERVNRLLRDRSAAMVEGLSTIVAARDARMARHSRRVRELALLVGRELGLSEADLEALGLAAHFHDIGKLAVPEAILLKPWSLSAEEWAVVRRHPEEGARLIEQLGFLAHLAPAIRHHHEHFDGEGYPEGLRGESIPLDARIIHVAEAFDSMCTNQSYRPARPYNAALSELRWLAGGQFDPLCVSALERALATAPAEARASTSDPAS